MLQAGQSGVQFLVESRDVSSPYRPDWLLSPLNLLLNRYWEFFLRVELTRVKNEWSYTYTPHIITSWCR
jgi:hypothetical protein